MHHEICWHAWIEDKEIFSWKIKINTIVFITQHLLYYFLSASLKVLECYLVPFVKSHQEHYLKPLLFYFQNYVSILGHCGHFFNHCGSLIRGITENCIRDRCCSPKQITVEQSRRTIHGNPFLSFISFYQAQF